MKFLNSKTGNITNSCIANYLSMQLAWIDFKQLTQSFRDSEKFCLRN